jgi:hypothetical protein
LTDNSKYSEEVRKLNEDTEIFFYSDNYSMSMYCEVRCFVERNLIFIVVFLTFMLYFGY